MGQDSAVESGVNSSANSTDNGVETCNHRRGPHGSRENVNDKKACSGELDVEMRTLNLQSQLSHSDPNLYGGSRQSEGVSKGEVFNSLHNKGSRSSCSQSTQSTSTSAEFSPGHANLCEENMESLFDGLVSHSDKDCDLNATFSEKGQGHDLDDSDLAKNTGSSEPVEYGLTDKPLPSADLPKTFNSPEVGNTANTGLKSDSQLPSTVNWDEPCSTVTGSMSACFDSLTDSQTVDDAEEEKRFFQSELFETESGQRSK